MTIDEFIEQLKATPRQWRFGPPNKVVGELHPPRQIRSGERCDCPITAAVGERHPVPSMAIRSAYAMIMYRKIGLSEEDAVSIIRAADWKPNHEALRKRLVEACGLVEMETA